MTTATTEAATTSFRAVLASSSSSSSQRTNPASPAAAAVNRIQIQERRGAGIPVVLVLKKVLQVPMARRRRRPKTVHASGSLIAIIRTIELAWTGSSAESFSVFAAVVGRSALVISPSPSSSPNLIWSGDLLGRPDWRPLTDGRTSSPPSNNVDVVAKAAKAKPQKVPSRNCTSTGNPEGDSASSSAQLWCL